MIRRASFPAVFGVLMGTGMLAMWTMFFVAGEVPESSTEPVRLAFHLAAEAGTALVMIAAGAGLIRGAAWARDAYVFGVGMLFYTMVVSPGYFAQQGQWAFVTMFAGFATLAVLALRGLRGAA